MTWSIYMRLIQQKLAQFIPFFYAGIAIALSIGAIILFSYLLFWGIFIAGLLYLVTLIKRIFISPKQAKIFKGRIIEHQDLNDRQ